MPIFRKPLGRILRGLVLLSLALLFAFLIAPRPAQAAEAVPDDFPRFIVPGHEAEMNLVRELFWHHYQNSGPLIPVWDEWLAMSTLWPARRNGAELDSMRQRWAAALESRVFDADGYVSSQQHNGLGHALGWPFPTWMQAGGIGWHFAPVGVHGYEPRRATTDGWRLSGARGEAIDDKGWPVEIMAGAGSAATIQTPPFAVQAKVAPWLRLNWWASGVEHAKCYVEWTTRDRPKFGPDRRVYFAPASSDLSRQESRTMIPMYGHADWSGTITGLRIGFELQVTGAARSSIVIKSFHTASDTRHNVNDSNFIRAAHDYFHWTGDVDFLRSQIGRIRTAMRFNMREFDTRRRKCIYTTWPGHEGRSGLRYPSGHIGGSPEMIRGQGIGSDYWDLLPFGGEDALATIYYYDAVCDLAELEEEIGRHPQWKTPANATNPPFDSADLRRHAQEVKDYGTKRFWNPATGRFGTVDLDGKLHDYGFTFLNNEAVYYDFATPEQARSIYAWLSGERIVAGDTSTGPDIYHWRFGPRSTTRRNVDYYFWGWRAPESLPFGGQVQDGGAVLGFSYHDLMARLKTAGPGDAANRLSQIAAWYRDVLQAGGYREYYRDPARGTLQGCGTAGGLGLDCEFYESILVPQVMLYGFLGLRPTVAGCRIEPRLPSDWPSLEITRIHLHDHVLDIRATRNRIDVVDHTPSAAPLKFDAPPNLQLVVSTTKEPRTK